MILPIQITFRNMKSSETVQKWIEQEAGKLDRFYDRITGCRVMVEMPNRRRVSGGRYHVRIDLTAPGSELVVARQPSQHWVRQIGETRIRKDRETAGPHRELRQAINDAFKEMGRRLQDYASRQRGDVKGHSATPVPQKIMPAGNGKRQTVVGKNWVRTSASQQALPAGAGEGPAQDSQSS